MRSWIVALLAPMVLVAAACTPGAQGPALTATAAAPTVAAIDPTPAGGSSVPVATTSSGDVVVVMSDAMRFTPDAITVSAGEPITFKVRNDGVIVHEFFVGTEAEQIEHEAEMAAMPMSHSHGNAISLQPGESGSLTMTFPAAGTLLAG